MNKLRILAVFDAGDSTIDRYTFVTNIQTRPGYYEMLGTSETGAGFSQWCEGSYTYHGDNSHLGKQIKWRDLPASLQAHVEERIAE